MAWLQMGYFGHKGAASHNMGTGLYNGIKYICNPDKTEDKLWIGGHNLYINPDPAKIEDSVYARMKATKREFNADRVENSRQGYHFKLSFAKYDDVTPELAMQITEEFCQECFNDYECLYSVHNNTEHLHSHLIFNSINMIDGKKYHYNKDDWAKELQPALNRICKSYGLSEIKIDERTPVFDNKTKTKKYTKDNLVGSAEHITVTNAMMKTDVDLCIEKANNYDEWKSLMQDKGYVINDEHKHITILGMGRQRATRLYSLTPDKQTYTRENLDKMIKGTYMTRDEVKNQLYADFNSYRQYGRLKIKIFRVSKELAQIMEERELAEEKNFKSFDDVRNYLDYLERADKELNIVKKSVRDKLKDKESIFEEMNELFANYEGYKQFRENGDATYKESYDKVVKLYNSIKDKGYHLSQLYNYQNIGQTLLTHLDDYKKHIFVEKRICKRILDTNNLQARPEQNR